MQHSFEVLENLIAEYPEIASLRLEGVQHHGLEPDREQPVHYLNNAPRWIPCSNPECTGPGYYMASILAKLTKEHATAYDGDWVCDKCSNAFRFSLKLTYTDEANESFPMSAVGD